MTNDYQDLQHLDNEDNGHQLRQAPPPPQRLFRRLCSGPCFLLLSLGLGLLLLVVVCVIGSQNSKLRDELRALRVTFSNFTASTEVEVKALSSQGGSVGRKLKSLESQLQKQQQQLSEDHSSLLLHVKQFVSDLRSLSCQIGVLHGNGSAASCCPVNWLEFEGSCYWFSRSGKSWPEADKYCRLENAHLVVVGSWEEQELEAGAAGRLVRARAGRGRGLRALHGRRPLERRRVPETLPLGVRDRAGRGRLGAPPPPNLFPWRPHLPDDAAVPGGGRGWGPLHLLGGV
ncbi:asialoglycoprotein receptor 1-like isoform X2 [Panthera uncia]|uniref:asialoglycoprotein receptor 1-like isoform X2 n=1 Tax=Panthera uncia TaxID=29064 RepID=UPI0020FFE076|nr:asialoglycoprotein receptor 1-like isoform X2 [Panthera uncia]